MQGDVLGLVQGYRTLNAIGVGMAGLLYHELFSSHAADFVRARRGVPSQT
jgi:hypothetical protein